MDDSITKSYLVLQMIHFLCESLNRINLFKIELPQRKLGDLKIVRLKELNPVTFYIFIDLVINSMVMALSMIKVCVEIKERILKAPPANPRTYIYR